MSTGNLRSQLAREAYGAAFDAEVLRHAVQRTATDTDASTDAGIEILGLLADADEALAIVETRLRAAASKMIAVTTPE